MSSTKSSDATFIAVIVVCLIIIAGAFYVTKIATDPQVANPTATPDCIEWGIERTNRDGSKEWVRTLFAPRNREEAEQKAKELEDQDMGGRYYVAKCKRRGN